MVGAVAGVVLVVILAILFFRWAGGISTYDILTLDQQGRLELEGLAIFYMQVLAVFLAAPLGCWFALRKARAAAAGATALLMIPWSWMLSALVLRHVPTGPEDPIVLPWASLATVAVAAALARATALIVHARFRQDT